METITTELEELTGQRIEQEKELERISYMGIPGIALSKDLIEKFKKKYYRCRYSEYLQTGAEKEMFQKGYEEIIKIVAQFFAVDIFIPTRKYTIKFPRQIAHYFAYQYTRLSLQQIANPFKQDHTTILNSLKVIDNLFDSNCENWNYKSYGIEKKFTNVMFNHLKAYRFNEAYSQLETKIIDKLIKIYTIN